MDVEPAPAAAQPQCAAVLARLRSDAYAVVGERRRRETDAQSTAAWGDPPVVLRCGVTPPGPTTDPCLTVEGVDWVAREADDAVVFTTFGRAPALEVSVPPGGPTGADAVLAALAPVAARLPQERTCL